MKMLPSKRAHCLVKKAIERGELTRLEYCEVCEKTTDTLRAERKTAADILIFGHHWKGYNHPLDVWWVCHSCNMKLAGRHDGKLATPKDARAFIVQRYGFDDPEYKKQLLIPDRVIELLMKTES